MADLTLPQCVMAEKEFAVMSGQVENLVRSVEKLNTALMGNGKPGVLSEISALKAHIGFNQTRTMHERMTTVEDILAEIREQNRRNSDAVRSVILPIVREIIVFVGGGLAYVIVTQFVK